MKIEKSTRIKQDLLEILNVVRITTKKAADPESRITLDINKNNFERNYFPLI
jgi:hypothetical protein